MQRHPTPGPKGVEGGLDTFQTVFNLEQNINRHSISKPPLPITIQIIFPCDHDRNNLVKGIWAPILDRLGSPDSEFG